MLYNLANELDATRLSIRLSADIKKGAVVEYTGKQFRSPNQNRYLHLVIGVVAMETGNTLAFTKEQYFKRLVNAEVFVQDREDQYLGKVQVLRSSRDLTVEEMRIAIDKFKRWAAENGIYIPDPEDEERLREIEIEMGRLKTWL